MATKTTTRRSTIKRKTAETAIELAIAIDGTGKADVATGVGFLDHMLTLFARHGLFDLRVSAIGDLHIDPHHTVEDVGICLGQALNEAEGDKAGIRRYGDTTLPMDEALVTVAIDLSGRPYFVWKVRFETEKIGEFDSQLVEEFWHAVTIHSRMNFHVVLHHGHNSHHVSEAIFKSAARSLATALERLPRVHGVPSTKGTL